METTTTTTAVPPLELTRAPRKTPSLDLRDIPQAPGPEKGVLALMAMDPATYVGQCVTIGMTEDYFYLPAHKLLWRLFQARYNKTNPLTSFPSPRLWKTCTSWKPWAEARAWQKYTPLPLPEPILSITSMS